MAAILLVKTIVTRKRTYDPVLYYSVCIL